MAKSCGTVAEPSTITATEQKYSIHNLGTFSQKNVPFTSFLFHWFTFLWSCCCDAMVDFKLHSGWGHALILLNLFFWYLGLQRIFYSIIKIWLLPRETDIFTASWLDFITRWNLWPHFVSPLLNIIQCRFKDLKMFFNLKIDLLKTFTITSGTKMNVIVQCKDFDFHHSLTSW